VRPRRTGLIDVVEAAYDLGGADERGWAQQILRAFRGRLDLGMGVCAYVSDEKRPFEALAAIGVPDGWAEAMAALMQSPVGPLLMRARRPAITGSDSVGKRVWTANDAMRLWHSMGIHDGLGIIASDGTGRVMQLVAPMPAVGRLAPKVAGQFEQAAAHIAAGWRLRRQASGDPCAVLSPSGAVLHAEGRARERDARESLRAAAVAIDRARGRLRRTAEDEALTMWRVLVSGEWSLIDQFDRDGRRYMVARKNEPYLRDPRALTLRERQVLAATALGHSVKLIAYELGISPSMVSRLRGRAMRKLRLESLLDVVRLMSTVSAVESAVVAR
jgi:DNA-binding CsgD family transcriptional regulator